MLLQAIESCPHMMSLCSQHTERKYNIQSPISAIFPYSRANVVVYLLRDFDGNNDENKLPRKFITAVQ